MQFKTFAPWGVALGLLVMTSCGQQETSTPTTPSAPPTETTEPKITGEVNLYSSRHYDSDAAMYAEFTKETGIKVNLIEGKDDELIERIKGEGANSPADILITVDVARLWRSQQEGLFQPIDSTVLNNAIPETLRSKDNTWYGFTKRARVIAYNTQKVKPSELSTYEDLANPKWKGRICIRSSNNVYNQSLVAALIVQDGETATTKWLKGLVSNFAREPEGNDTNQIEAVAAGECDIAVVNHYYVARLKQSDDPKNKQIVANIGVFFPNSSTTGTHINISGAGVAKNAPHRDNAVKFLEFLTTPNAQEIFANQNNEYPVITGMKPNEVVASFGEFKASPLPLADLGEKNPDAVKLMDQAGWK